MCGADGPPSLAAGFLFGKTCAKAPRRASYIRKQMMPRAPPHAAGSRGFTMDPNGAVTDIARMKPSQFGIGIPIA